MVRARRPGIKRKRTSDATALAPTELESKNEVPSLDEVVSSLSSKILPVLEQKIETIISRGSEAKETENNEGTSNCSYINQDLNVESDVFTCNSLSITSANDELGVHVPQATKQK